MSFDPVSHAAGIGAGQEEGRRAAAHAELTAAAARQQADLARIHANGAENTSMALAVAFKRERDAKEALQADFQNKWAPYMMHLKASVMASSIVKAHLLNALKNGGAMDADNIAQETDKLFELELRRLLQTETGGYDEIVNIVNQEAEAVRLQKESEKARAMQAEAARIANDLNELKRRAEEAERQAEQQYLDSLPSEIRKLTAHERQQQLRKLLDDFSMGIIRQLPAWVVREQARPEEERKQRQAEIARQAELVTRQEELAKSDEQKAAELKARITKAREQFNLGLINELPAWAR